MTEERETDNPTMGFNDIACALRDWFAPINYKMGSQGNTFWLMMAAEDSGAIKLVKKGKGMFSETYELVAGSIDGVIQKVFDYYNSQFH